MTTITTKSTFTPEDLLNLSDGVNYELVDGQLVERKMGSESSMIAMVIGTILTNFVRARKLGLVGGADCSYQCFPDAPEKVRHRCLAVESGRPASLPAVLVRSGPHQSEAPDGVRADAILNNLMEAVGWILRTCS